METCTNKGVSCFIHNKYTQYYVKKTRNVCWRCTHKACKARIETQDGTVVSEWVSLSHSEGSKRQRDCPTYCVQEEIIRTPHGAPSENNTYSTAGNELRTKWRVDASRW